MDDPELYRYAFWFRNHDVYRNALSAGAAVSLNLTRGFRGCSFHAISIQSIFNVITAGPERAALTSVSAMIHETIVTTAARDGRPHIAPMGVRFEDGLAILAPFRPSATLDNIIATRAAVINFTTDVRVFAGCVTGSKKDWQTLPATLVNSVRLADSLAHTELELDSLHDDPQRPVLRLKRVYRETHGPFEGFNRAQSAVVEGAILVSRLFMLPADKVDNEMAYLQIAIDKTAGEREHMAWDWITAAVARHRENTKQSDATRDAPREPDTSASERR